MKEEDVHAQGCGWVGAVVVNSVDEGLVSVCGRGLVVCAHRVARVRSNEEEASCVR
jgi:hypothetical protein